jgi:plasmid stability protein
MRNEEYNKNMSILITLPEELERKLRERAAQRGQQLEEFARTILEQEVQSGSPTPQTQGQTRKPNPMRATAEEWIAELRAWVDSHKPFPVIADDSRESIYAGRGE